MIFFIKNPNLKKKIWWLVGEGVGWGVARVIFFLFSKESKSEKKMFSWWQGKKGGRGVEWGLE